MELIRPWVEHKDRDVGQNLCEVVLCKLWNSHWSEDKLKTLCGHEDGDLSVYKEVVAHCNQGFSSGRLVSKAEIENTAW